MKQESGKEQEMLSLRTVKELTSSGGQGSFSEGAILNP